MQPTTTIDDADRPRTFADHLVAIVAALDAADDARTAHAHPCTVCGAEIGWAAPSGVCGSECLRRGQGFTDPPDFVAIPLDPADCWPVHD